MRKESRFGLAPAVATLAILLAGPVASAAGSTATAYESATTGTAELASGPSPATQLASQRPARGARRVPLGLTPGAQSTSAPSASGTLAPSTPSAPSASAPSSPTSSSGQGLAAAALLENFNGVSSRDSEVTNFGLEFEPPDQGLCVGNGFVVEMVNSAYTVYRPSGAVVAGPFNINGPFNEGLTEFTSDPRCYFDRATDTWFATILFINSTSTESHLDIAVNASGDPTKVWTDYRIDTTGIGGKTGPKHPGCPCFGDQPTLGIDGHNVYVSTNEFSILGEQFYGAQIYAIAKQDLVSHSATVHFAHFGGLRIGGAVAASVQPALSGSSAASEFFLNSLDPTETFDQRIGVWALTDTAAVATGGKPKLSSLVLTSEAYGKPPRAEQKGASSLIESDDDRMQQTQFIDGNVWGELNTALTIPGDPVQRAGAAWFEVKPVVADEALSSAQIKRQGYVAVPGSYLLYPALQVAPNGLVAMTMTLSGKTHYPSAAYAVMSPGNTAFGPVKIAAAGTTNYDPAATRWGDYSWAVVDPSGASVWLATEYVPPGPSQTTDGLHDWGTRVFDVATGAP